MIKYLLNPFNLLWICGVIILFLVFLNRIKAVKVILIISSLIFLITSNFLLPKFLISTLEDKFDPCCPEWVYADSNITFNIIVLGSGFGDDKKLPYTGKLVASALARLVEGIRIHRTIPNSFMIMSGPPDTEGFISQAEVIARASIELGVKREKVVVQGQPSNTYEEAEEYFKVFGNSRPLILVTSAVHMPRAYETFSKFEIKIIPAPTNYIIKQDEHKSNSWLPSSSNMNKMGSALIEYSGIMWYRIKYF